MPKISLKCESLGLILVLVSISTKLVKLVTLRDPVIKMNRNYASVNSTNGGGGGGGGRGGLGAGSQRSNE